MLVERHVVAAASLAQQALVRHAAVPVPRGPRAAQNVVEYGLLIATLALIVLLAGNVLEHQLGPWFALLAGRITTVGT